MPRLGLRSRIIAIALSVTLAGVGTAIAVTGHIFQREYSAALQSRSVAIAEGLSVELKRLLALGLNTDSIVGFDEQCREAIRTHACITYAMVIAGDGTILFHNRPDIMGRRESDPAILDAVRLQAEGGAESVTRDAITQTAVVPVFGPAAAYVASVAIGFPTELVAAQVRQLVFAGAGVGILILASGALALVVAVSVFITRPIGRLVEAVENMQGGGAAFFARVEVHADDEIGRLGVAFNDMGQRLLGVMERERMLAAQEAVAAEHAEHLAAIDKLAKTDGLTGLANRRVFMEAIKQAIKQAENGIALFAIMYIDLDHFKEVNDTLGHAIGDALLRTVAGRLASAVRETDLVARLGGDEFAVLQVGIANVSSTSTLATRIGAAVAAPYTLDGYALRVTASIGIAPYLPDTKGPDGL
ncbi:MAG: hypothetical protein QOH18_2213, partial [Solirubrobacterales bacterium]|nr:hypothetical protein [Solirubrobacterales bacterium]